MAFLVYAGAALAEIAGCFSFWAWLRMGKSPLWLVPGMGALALFAYLLTLTPSEAAGRACAAYGGVYIVASILWLWIAEGVGINSCDLPASAAGSLVLHDRNAGISEFVATCGLSAPGQETTLLGVMDKGVWQVGEADNAHAMWKASFDRRLDEVGREEGERYRHVDLADAAAVTRGDAFRIRRRVGGELIEPAASAGNR